MVFLFYSRQKKTHRRGGLFGVYKMTREEFRANLYQTYVSTGMNDHALIQEYIHVAESFVFDKKKHTKIDEENLIKKFQN